jgi:hypothetical protein
MRGARVCVRHCTHSNTRAHRAWLAPAAKLNPPLPVVVVTHAVAALFACVAASVLHVCGSCLRQQHACCCDCVARGSNLLCNRRLLGLHPHAHTPNTSSTNACTLPVPRIFIATPVFVACMHALRSHVAGHAPCPQPSHDASLPSCATPHAHVPGCFDAHTLRACTWSNV